MENIFKYLVWVVGAGLMTGIVWAQEAQPLGFSVSESVFDLEIPAGGSYEGNVAIMNGEGNISTPIHVELALWDLKEDSDDIEFVHAEPALNATKWFTLDSGYDLILDAGEDRQLDFGVKVPSEASPGSYLVMMRLQAVLPEHYFSESGPRLVPEMGLLFLIKVPLSGLDIGQEPYSAEITGLEAGEANRINFLESVLPNAQAGVFDRALQELTAKIRNNGIYFFKAKGKIEIKNIIGRTVGVVELPERYLLPDKERSIGIDLNKEKSLIVKTLSELYFGPFSANISLVTPDNQLIGYSVNFWVIPWKAWILLAVIIATAVSLFRRFGGRLKLALRAMFGR